MRAVLTATLTLALALAGCLDDPERAEYSETAAALAAKAAAEAGSDVFKVGSVEVSKDFLIGTWTTKSCSGTIHTTFHADGSYSGRMVRTDGRVAKYINGTWTLGDGKLIWVHDSDTSRTKRGAQDINPVVSAGENSFTVKETNGRRTTFQRAR